MLEGLMLASYGIFNGGDIGNLLSQFEQAGFFAYLLPFLLIFAIVSGILNAANIFKNRAIHAIIAFAVSLMSLQFGFVSEFFSAIFPRLGIALAVILVILILIGLFGNPENNSGVKWTLVGVGGVIAIIVLVNTAGSLGWSSGYWWSENWGSIVALLVFLGLITVLVVPPKPPQSGK